MTKTDVFVLWTRRDYVAYLHLLVADDHPIDEQFHQLASLLEGQSSQAAPHTSAEIFYGGRHVGKLRALIDLHLQLPLLSGQCLFPLLQITAPPPVLGERDDLPEVSFRQPVQLPSETGLTLAEVLLAGLKLLRQPVPSVSPLQRVRDALRVSHDLAQVPPDQLVELVGGRMAGGALLLQAGLGLLLLAGADRKSTRLNSSHANIS